MIFDRLRRLFGGDPGRGGGDGAPEMISCPEALTRLQEFVDGELHGLTREQVEEHFELCTRCYPHLRLEENFRAKVQAALSRCEVPDDLRARVLESLAREGAGEN